MKYIENARKLRPIIERAMQSIEGNDALAAKALYPSFESIVGQTVNKGFKFTHADKLWSVVQAELLIQSHFAPGVGTESLYTEICEAHTGAIDDPIPYNGNMTLINGLYYMQDYEIYLCNRNTVNPVHNALSELVGLYVELV